MGRITDWEKVFENLDYLFYKAFLLSEEKIGFIESEFFEEEESITKKTKQTRKNAIGYEAENRIRSEEAFFNEAYLPQNHAGEFSFEKYLIDFLENYEKINSYTLLTDKLKQDVLMPFLKDEEKMVGTDARYTNEKNLGKIGSYINGDKLSERIKFVSEEGFFKEKDEKNLFRQLFYQGDIEGVMEEKYPRGKREVKKIIESGQKVTGEEKRDVKIELHNVNQVNCETDIDRIADMLTVRLCEIMQKSAEGFYM